MIDFEHVSKEYRKAGPLALAWVYPFMKRYTHLPQVVLGAAFGWSIPMAFSAVSEALPLSCWLMFLANILWAVAYDTRTTTLEGELYDKDGVLSQQTNQHNQRNLHVDIVRVTEEVGEDERTCQRRTTVHH